MFTPPPFLSRAASPLNQTSPLSTCTPFSISHSTTGTKSLFVKHPGQYPELRQMRAPQLRIPSIRHSCCTRVLWALASNTQCTREVFSSTREHTARDSQLALNVRVICTVSCQSGLCLNVLEDPLYH